MSGTPLALLAIAGLFSLGGWLSTRAAGLAEIELLPAQCRSRVRWWRGNARYVQSACAVVAVAATCVQIARTMG